MVFAPRPRALAVCFSRLGLALALSSLPLVTVNAVVADDDADDPQGAEVRGVVVEIIDGRTNIRIDPADQARLGIAVTQAISHRYVVEFAVFGRVVATSGLVELRGSLIEARGEGRTLATAIAAQQLMIDRINEMQAQGLAYDYAQLQRERRILLELEGRRRAAVLRIRQLRDRAVHDWGARLGRAIGDESDPLVADIVHRRRYLLVTERPPGEGGDFASANVMIEPNGNRDAATPGELIGPATAVFGARGRSVFVVGARSDLRSGMRVSIWFGAKDNTLDGYLVPREALVWYAGNQWIYVQRERGRFERHRVEGGKYFGDKVFLEHGIGAGDEVVLTGAPSLLGEEFRWSIPDEDDD